MNKLKHSTLKQPGIFWLFQPKKMKTQNEQKLIRTHHVLDHWFPQLAKESPKKLLNTKCSWPSPGLLNNINKTLGRKAKYFDDTAGDSNVASSAFWKTVLGYPISQVGHQVHIIQNVISSFRPLCSECHTL